MIHSSHCTACTLNKNDNITQVLACFYFEDYTITCSVQLVEHLSCRRIQIFNVNLNFVRKTHSTWYPRQIATLSKLLTYFFSDCLKNQLNLLFTGFIWFSLECGKLSNYKIPDWIISFFTKMPLSVFIIFKRW